jgi:hypothetical protein
MKATFAYRCADNGVEAGAITSTSEDANFHDLLLL